MMDDATLGKAIELGERMRALRHAMDVWEKQEKPITPAGVDMGTFTFLGKPAPTADEAAWKIYRRASIEALQREYDTAADEFKRL